MSLMNVFLISEFLKIFFADIFQIFSELNAFSDYFLFKKKKKNIYIYIFIYFNFWK